MTKLREKRVTADLRVATGLPNKAPTGIAGFDEITAGGLPRGRTTLLLGEPGSGMTIFALEFLVHGARDCNEPGIFVAFEETSKRIVFDAIDVVLALLTDPVARRTEIYRLHDWLFNRELTAVITAKAGGDVHDELSCGGRRIGELRGADVKAEQGEVTPL